MPRLIQPLPDGPLDVIGDVHGELEALLALLHRLGVNVERRTAARPVVFVGDLVDRGPDSIGVVDVFARLADAGLAYAVAGNHELNLLADDRKEGNGWYWGDTTDAAQLSGKHVPFGSRPADDADRARVRARLAELPLVLARADLRVVHAAWDAAAAAALPAEGDLATLAATWADRIATDLDARGVPARAAEERAAFAELRVEAVRPDRHLPAAAEEDAAHQLHNPVKLLTSGAEVEVRPGEHFFVGGKWRFVTRDRWWRRPVDIATVVGHYWRRRSAPIHGKRDLWGDLPIFGWSGGVFCVDYSVGRRYAERAAGRDRNFDGGLGALRWPERTLVFDDWPNEIPAYHPPDSDT